MAIISWKYDSRKYCTMLEVWPRNDKEKEEIYKWILARKLEEPKWRGDRRHTFLYSKKRKAWSRFYFELFFKDQSEALAFKIQWQS